MKSYIAGWLFLFAGCFVAGCGGTKSNSSKPEERQESKTDDSKNSGGQKATGLDGTWTLVSQTHNGKKDEKEVLKISIAGNKMTINEPKSITITIKVDPTKTPHEIDFISDDLDDPEGDLGIYELAGDTLKIASGVSQRRIYPPTQKGEQPKKEIIHSPRPKNFDAAEGVHVMILKRG